MIKIDVVIATWNRERLLHQTLQSLGRLRVPAGVAWAVHVCDNNSKDQTRFVVASAARQLKGHVDLSYLFEPRQGKSYALNRMIQQTDGDWICFLDDDVLVTESWMEAYVRGIARYPRAGCLGGPIQPWLEQPVGGRGGFLLKAYPMVFGLMSVEADIAMRPPEICAWGANMAVRRVALPTEGFDANRGMMGGRRIAGEDVGMVHRVLEAGYEGWLLAGAEVRHWIPWRTVRASRLWRWNVGIGRVWAIERGKATSGKFGVPWWAWKEFARRTWRVGSNWRPWPTRAYYDAMRDAAQYLGYLLASR